MNHRMGLSELTSTQQKEAQAIAMRAKARHGGCEKAGHIIGISKATVSTIVNGTAVAGSKTYAKLKQYESKQLEVR